MLFQGLPAGQPTAPTPPRLATPFGEIFTCATAATLDTTHTAPQQQMLLPGGTEWRCWSTDAAVAEVLIGPYRPVLPPHMDVQGSVAAVWRVQARQPLLNPALQCRWPAPPANADGGPDSGEGLDAQTWSISDAALSMGTEDGEFLARRAHQENLVPARLGPELHVGTVRYIDQGLQVPFSSLEPSELVQVHFVVAWADYDDPYRVDTWYAVDQSPAEILRQLAGARGRTHR